MAVALVQFENGEPTFFEIGKTVNDLKSKLDTDNEDKEGFIEAINSADLSGVSTKFEIRNGVWILFA